MNIDKAIELLTLFKNKGETDIILAAWTAGTFGLQNNSKWPALAEMVEESMDWSHVHGYMNDMIEDELTDEELSQKNEE